MQNLYITLAEESDDTQLREKRTLLGSGKWTSERMMMLKLALRPLEAFIQ